MVVCRLLEARDRVEYKTFAISFTYKVHSDGHTSLPKTAGRRGAGQTCQVDGSSIDIRKVHRDRVFDFTADFESHARAHGREDKITN